MVGVDLEPVLGGVASGLRVTAGPRPRLLGQAADQRRRAGAHRFNHRERGLERQGVIIEEGRPVVLVVSLDQGILLGRDDPDPRVGVRLGVGAVADDLVGRPLFRRRAPLEGLGRNLGQGRPEPGRTVGVLLNERVALGAVESHGQCASSLRRSTFASPSGAKPSWSRAWPESKYSRYAAIRPPSSSKMLIPLKRI